MTLIPQRYRLNPGPTRVTLTLLPQTGAYFTLGGNPEPLQSFSCGAAGQENNAPVWFTVSSPSGLTAAQAEVAYDPPQPQLEWRSPSTCHLYFKPGSLDWIWTGAAIAGDNPTILTDGEGPHTDSAIAFRPPTRPNVARGPRLFPSLDSSRVSLLDRNGITGNMIFRGNAPLAPTPGNQLVDFDMLHNTLKFAYFNLTGHSDFPEKGRYVLRSIALLDGRAEAKLLQREVMSFGGSEASAAFRNRTWFPGLPDTVSRSGILAQMTHWPVPASDILSDSALGFVKLAAMQLRAWMNRREELPQIYYVHCADGHERAGVMSAWYMLTNREMSVSDAYMLSAAANGFPVGL